MSYVQELRALVGQRPLILVAAGVLVLDKEERLLLQRRTDDGLWGIPGGSLELGETLEEAARRELREETGLEAGDLTLFDVFSGDAGKHIYPNGDPVEIVSAVYLTKETQGAMKADGNESAELRFFTHKELQTVPLSGINQAILRRFLQSQTRSARQGWEAQFDAMAAAGDPRLLDAEPLVLTTWEAREWEW